MEALGVVGSAISILDLAQKLNGLRITVKDAEKEWQRYCKGLEAVACIQNVLDTIIRKYPKISELVVQSKGMESPLPLVKHLNIVLEEVVKEANTLLERYDQLTGWRGYFSRALKTLKLVLDKETIVSLLKSVEEAHHHLHLGLMLISLHNTNSWQDKTDSLLNQIKADMTEHSQVLKEMSGHLSKATFDLDSEEGICGEGKQNASAPRDHRPRKNKWPRGYNLRKKKQNAMTIIPSSTKESLRHAETSSGSGQQGVEYGDDGGHDADNDSGDNEGTLIQDMANTGIPKTSHIIPNESRYAIIKSDGKLVQVPVDSEIYQSATSVLDSDNSRASPPATSTAIRVEEIIESLSEYEWEKAQHLPIDELMDFLTSAQSTACASDAETSKSEPHSPITIDSHCESHIFISEKMNLALFRTGAGSTVRKFCTDRVSITYNTQVFCAIEPCVDGRSPKCRHITMEIENGDVFATKDLPCKIQLASLRVGREACDILGDSSRQCDCSVSTFSCSPRRCLSQGRRCLHTVFDQDGRVECSMPAELFASLQSTTDDSDAGTERAPSEAEVDIDHTKNDQHEEQMAHAAGFPTNPNPDDDERAFTLLRMIVLFDTYEPPSEIEWDVLIRFLSLIDKYNQYVGEKAVNQAKSWASLIQPSETFDQNAVPWLWVMWKLHLKPEFSKLSATIQRQARSPISHWQDGPENKYGIKLPELILNQLDQRRLEVLSIVRDRMTTEMEKLRQAYVDASEDEFQLRAIGNIMRSSLAFGYLKLESDRCLKSQDPGLDADIPDFWGVSFADVKECILSMQDLGNWKICTVPIADRMPTILAMASSFIPVLGVGLHNEGFHVRLDTGFNELRRLIGQLEREGWGIDLSQTEE